jgi:hypothetical protein
MRDYTAEIKSCLIEPAELTRFKDENYKEMDLVQKGDFLEFLTEVFSAQDFKGFVLANANTIGDVLGNKVQGLEGDQFIAAVKGLVVDKFSSRMSL